MTWYHNITKWYDQSRNKKICKRCSRALEAYVLKWENFFLRTFLCCTSHHCNSNHLSIIELWWFFQIWKFKILKAIHQTICLEVHYQCKPSPNIITKYGFSSTIPLWPWHLNVISIVFSFSKTKFWTLILECYIHSFFF